MLGVIVEFRYGDGDDFDRERVLEIAHGARGRFAGMQGLRQKAFTLDEEGRRATNVYLWHSEDAARAFFTEEQVDRIAGLYGVRPTVTFVEVVELVDNG
jgi:heme-degrading monooxygenase HmoA